MSAPGHNVMLVPSPHRSVFLPLLFQVHIYVDAVINHMCGNGVSAGTSSTCGSFFNPGRRDFPAVPFSAWDFNDGKCRSPSGDIENYHDAYQVTGNTP